MGQIETHTIPFEQYAILASGQGSNALALIEQGILEGRPPAFVVVNNKESRLLETAEKAGVRCHYIPSSEKGLDKIFESDLLNLCQQNNVTWIFLAGFLKILSPEFLREFKEEFISEGETKSLYKVINIHPSLLPKYRGLSAYKKAFNNKDEFYGHTIHLVTEGVDEGPMLFQKRLERDFNDDYKNFVEKGKREENKSFQSVLKSLVNYGLYFGDDRPQLKWDIKIKE